MPNIKINFAELAKSTSDLDTINLLINMNDNTITNNLLMYNPNITEEHIKLINSVVTRTNSYSVPRIFTDEIINKYPCLIKFNKYIFRDIIYNNKLEKIPDNIIIDALKIHKLRYFDLYDCIKNLIDKLGKDIFIDLILEKVITQNDNLSYELNKFLDKFTELGITLTDKQIKYLASVNNAVVKNLLIEKNLQEITIDENPDDLINQLSIEQDRNKLKFICLQLNKLTLTDEQYIKIANVVDAQNYWYIDSDMVSFNNCPHDHLINLIINKKIGNTNKTKGIIKHVDWTLDELLELLKHDYIDIKYNDDVYKYIIKHPTEFSNIVMDNIKDDEHYNKFLPVKQIIQNCSKRAQYVYRTLDKLTYNLSEDDLKLLLEFFNASSDKFIKNRFVCEYFEQLKLIHTEKELTAYLDINLYDGFGAIKKYNLYKYLTLYHINHCDPKYFKYIAENEETPLEVLNYLRNISGKGSNKIKNLVKANPTFNKNLKTEKATDNWEDIDSIKEIILEALSRGIIKQSDKDDLGIERDDNSIKDIWKSLTTQDFVSFKQQKYVELAKRAINYQ